MGKMLISISLLLVSMGVWAGGSSEPLLVKSISSGFTPEWASRSSLCEIFEEKIVIKKSAGRLTGETKAEITLTGDIKAFIKKAALGRVTETPAPTDGPITMYRGVHKMGSGDSQWVTLKARGSYIADNDSQAASILVNFLDQNCN